MWKTQHKHLCQIRKALGTIGTFGCYSFHETKNYTMGEGGAIVINDEKYIERAEIIREKGTNRQRFFRGQVDKYTWVDIGSSYLPSEFNVSYLYGQLLFADEINNNRLNSWKYYYDRLSEYENGDFFELQKVPVGCVHNAHMFWVKLKNITERKKFITYLKEKQIDGVFHYVPLHSSLAGKNYGVFCVIDRYTTKESERLVRLPMFYKLSEDQMDEVIKNVIEFITN